MEHSYGKMEPSIKAIGKITKHRASASSITSMAISTLVNGTSIKQMVLLN